MPTDADTYRHRLSTIMRADLIMVVMNGEIVEQGTHDELIHAKGKYHGLWSKQIYVKPADEPSRSQSPKKRDAEIINDLTPSRQKIELAKVMKTVAHEEPAGHEDANEQSAKDAEQPPNDTQQPANGPANTTAQTSPKGKVAAMKSHILEVSAGSY